MEGTHSLARAFLAAGAGVVIASLWPVDDEFAAGFFARVHGAMTRGADAESALREAQLAVLRSGRAHHKTLAWCAFAAIGARENRLSGSLNE